MIVRLGPQHPAREGTKVTKRGASDVNVGGALLTELCHGREVSLQLPCAFQTCFSLFEWLSPKTFLCLRCWIVAHLFCELYQY